MPQVRLYQGGSIQQGGDTNARLQPANFGPGIAATALTAAGQGLKDFAETQDKIADVNAHIEASRLELQHANLADQIGQTVREAQGEAAEPAADHAVQMLHQGTQDILAHASPRARALLEPALGSRFVVARSGFYDHAFEEKKKAFESNATALIAHSVDSAAHEDNEVNALTLLKPALDQNIARGNFFGMGTEWVHEQNQKVVSQFYMSRALKVANSNGAGAGPSAAIAYATAHRQYLNDDDYNRIVDAYHKPALAEWADAEASQNPNPGVPAPDTPPAPAAGGAPTPPTARADWQQAWAFTSRHEGGYAAHDANGAPVNHGINQSANPDVDVAHLTEAGAGKLFHDRYWVPSGAADLPPALAVVHADTYYINPAEAKKLLAKSGGDPQKYMDMREAWQRDMVARNPAKFAPYDKAWTNRNRDLRGQAAQLGGGQGGTPLSPAHPLPQLADILTNVDRRQDLSFEQKQALKQAYRANYQEARQSRAEMEDDAHRQAIDTVVSLGDDKFTSTSQIPANVWTSLSPTDRDTLQQRAERNARGDDQKLSPALAMEIAYTRLADPTKFISPAYQQDLARRGAPAAILRQVASDAGTMAGTIASQKPEAMSSSEMWTLAKPAFEAAGLNFDTTQTSRRDLAGQAAENKQDALAKVNALEFLHDVSTRWAVANPGKKPDEALMRGWIGYAIRNYQSDAKGMVRIGTVSDIVSHFTPRYRAWAEGALRRNHVPVNEQTLYDFYKTSVAMNARPE